MNSPTPNPRHAARGFTLLELIISVALVLVLMLAVTKIFSITSATIGATQGIAAATRDARAAQAVFARDMAAMASDSPFIWIRYDAPFSAFRNAADEAADIDQAALTVDLNDDGKEGDSLILGESVSGVVISPRRHRLDRFAFFARDRYSRQTGNSFNNIMTSSLTSSEALIYYGPLSLPNNSGAFNANTQPGAGDRATNPNNYFASQWILGRFAPILIRPDQYGSAASTHVINDGTVSQEFYAHGTATTNAQRLSPYTSTTGMNAASSPFTLVDARYDLLGTNVETTKTQIRDYVKNQKDNSVTVTTANNWRTIIFQSLFQVNPFVVKPITSNTAARQVPQFINACSQFVVEYAGDFCAQDETGAFVDIDGDGVFNDPDGKIDFVVVNGSKQIKWYGYPRDMNGDLVVNCATNSPDVCPVADFLYPAGTLYSNCAYTYDRFEWYTAPATPPAATRKLYNTGTPSNFGSYYAVWGPDSLDDPAIPRPKMFRITIAIDRPEMAGRSADPQTFEYVFNVP